MPSPAPTLEDFTQALGKELQSRRAPYTPAVLHAFAAAVWPLAGEAPDVHRWAQHFIDTGHAAPAP
jgi:hypothetical protein